MDRDRNYLKTVKQEAMRRQRQLTKTVEYGMEFKDKSHLSE